MSVSTEIATPSASPSAPLVIDEETCRMFQTAVELAGRKWSAAVLLAAARGAERFSELRGLVHGITDRVLAARLKELEQNDLIERIVIPTTPVQVRYRLTASGRDLITVLQPVVDWGLRWGVDGAATVPRSVPAGQAPQNLSLGHSRATGDE